jgi:hypothetical protein
MKTGLESLDSESLDIGAPEITYSGNEGPKSPQEIEEQMMAGMMEDIAKDFEREFGYDMSLANPEVITEYIKEWKSRQDDTSRGPVLPNDSQGPVLPDRQMAADGGVMQLVKKNKDGSRPGYRGDYSYGDPTAKDYDPGEGKSETAGISESSGGFAPTSQAAKDTDGYKEPTFTGGATNYQDVTLSDDAKQKVIDDNLANEKQKLLDLRTSGVSDVKLPYVSGILNSKFIKDLRNKSLKTNIDYFLEQDTDYPKTIEGYKQYIKDRNAGLITASGNPIYQDSGGMGQQQTIPIQTAVLPETSEDLGTEFVSNFTSNELTDADKERVSNIGGKSIFLADGGRANYAGGGIADLRQGYFLGKLVKKATRGIKKIVKSPIGKAALLLGGGYLMNAGKFPGGFGESFFSNMFSSGMGEKIKNKFLMEKLKDGTYSSTDFDPFKIGILGASALTGLLAKKDQDEEVSLDQYLKTANRGPSLDPRGIREYIAMNKGNINPIDYAFLNQDYYQQVADGGRIGLMNGGIGKLRGALSKEMFNLGEDDEDEIKKLAMGGSAGMPPITGMSEGVDSMSFPDDESTGMAQATPTMPNQMPMRPPMMDSRMQQQMMMQQRMNPMMARGMMPRMMAQEGGRIGYQDGGNGDRNPIYQDVSRFLYGKDVQDLTDDEYVRLIKFTRENNAQGGRAGRVAAQEGGLMDMGGMEKDYRNEGGFVAIGGQERADDVPARLSKNEFVFTADAVRNAGGGDIDKGAEIMENMMENLEAGGKVSKASQGLSGAREMFATQQRLGEVL